MTHPLTDEIIEELAEDILCYEYNVRVFNQDMRAAADWQLEQVIEWLRDSLQDHRYSGIGIDVEYVIEDLQKEMRPTTTHGGRHDK